MLEGDRHMSARSEDPDAFYHRFRLACGPPMVRIASLDVGDLWFYDGLSLTVTACVGNRSLLVAYDTYGSQAEVASQFREAYEWLCGEHSEFLTDLHLVFAAREESSGELLVRRFDRGDWEGIPDNIPLPPTEHDCPSGWNTKE